MNENIVENNNEEKILEKKEVKTNWIVGIIVFIVILLAIGGVAYYFIWYQNADKYIDKISNKVSNFLSENISYNENNVNLDAMDIATKGNLKIENLADIDYDLKLSSEDEIFNLGLGLNANNKKIIDGTLYYQDQKMYLKSDKLIDALLEVPMDTNVNISEDASKLLSISNDDLKYFMVNIVKYYFEALKEGETSTKIVSLMEKEYSLKLDDITTVNANEKLEKLVSEDEKMIPIASLIDFDNFKVYSEGELVIKVNTWTNDIKDFSYKNNAGTLTGKYEDNMYILEDETNRLELSEFADGFKINFKENNENVLTLNYVKDKKVTINIMEDDFSMELTYNIIDEKNSSIELKAKAGTTNINLQTDTEKVNDNEYNSKVNASMDTDGEKVNFTLTNNMVLGKDLVEKINVSGAKDINNLSEEEQTTIMMNAYSLLGELGIGNIFE